MNFHNLIKFFLLISFLTFIFFTFFEWIEVQIKQRKKESAHIKMKETLPIRVARKASWGLVIINGIYLMFIIIMMFFSSVDLQERLSWFVKKPENFLSLFMDNWLSIVLFIALLIFEFVIRPKVK